MDVEEYVDAFRALFEERFGGEDVAALTRGMSTEELEAMPPFPFPKFLFPKGTFPDGLRFDESSFTAPPKVKAFVDEHGEDALAALASELAAKAAKNRGAGGETLTRGGLSEEEELRAFIMDAMKDELDGLQFPEGEDMDEAMARLMESMQDFAGGINGLGRDYGDSSDGENGEFGYGSPSYGSPSYGSPRFGGRRSSGVASDDSERSYTHTSALEVRRWLDAAKAGDLITMQILHKEQPSLVHERSSGVGHTAAHWAAAKGHVGALTWLLDACSFDPNFSNACGATALHSAAANGQETCAALLVARGARTDKVDEIGESPCDVAIRMQRSGKLIDILGGDTARTGVFCGVCEELPVVQEEDEIPAIELDKDAQRRWLGAAKAGDLGVMRTILDADENLLYANGDGTNYGFSGNTAMHWAASKNHVECIRWLYARGMDPNVINKGDSTPAHSAAGSGALEALRTLVHECGADVDRANDVDERPIDIATHRGYHDVVTLLKTGAALETLREEFLRQGSYTIKRAKGVLDSFAANDASCRGLSEKSEIVAKIQSYVDALPVRIERKCVAPKPQLRGAVTAPEPVDEIVTRKARDRANELLAAQDFTAAIASYSMAIRLDRANAALFCERSAANLGAGKIEDALADAKTAVKLDARLGIAYAAQAAALSAASLHAEAVKVCRAGLLEDAECDALRTQIVASERAIADDRARYEKMWGDERKV